MFVTKRFVGLVASAASLLLAAGCTPKTPPVGTTYTVSGTVSGAVASGVTVKLSGTGQPTPVTAVTDAQGNYSFAGIPNGSYTLTPSLASYTFNPTSLAVTVNGANATGQNFTSTAVAAPTYAISGTISGAAVAGVTVTLAGASSGTATTDASGNYSFTGLVSGSYTVTPSLAGYSFTPASRNVAVSAADVTGQNFTDAPITYSLSGTVSGAVMSGVTITLSGASTATTTTDASGNFAFQVPNGTYNVTPSMSGYIFNPISTSVAVNGANVSGTNFTATANSNPTHAISGRVSGLVAAGVTLTLSGANSGTVATDAIGNFSFTGLADGSYTLTPSVAGGYTFTPSSINVTLSGADSVGNNFGDTGAYSISGTVTGFTVAGVTLTITGGATTTTDSLGNYTFPGLPSGTYTVTPSLSGGFAFAPSSQSVTLTTASATGVNFSDSGAYTISGTVSGFTAAGVTVTLTGFATATATTDSSGNYTFTGVPNGSYTVTPSLAGGYNFTPANQGVIINNASVSGVNFSDTGAYSISGTVSGALIQGITLTLSGGASATTTTDSSGNFTIAGVPDGSYTITPSVAGGYVFTPGSKSVTVTGASVTGVSFSDSGAYSISGSVSGLAVSGVTITLSGMASGSVLTNGSGVFTFSGLPDGAYTLTPSFAGGYAFTPASQSVTISGGNVTGVSFTDTGAYSISGTVSGLAMAGVTITLSGTMTGTATTDSSGSYSFVGVTDGSYTVTPSLAGGYQFTPGSRSVTVSGASASGVSFSDSGAYAITGTVSGFTAAGVTMTLSGAASGTTTTDSLGNYSFTGLVNGTYTVTPSLAGGFSFAPGSRTVAISGGNATGQSFTDTGLYSISGNVAGLVASGVTITLSGGATATATTDGSGNYTITGVPNGSYTITPTLAGYAFSPPSRSFSINGASATGISFTDTGAYSISGNVAGGPSTGVTMRISGGVSGSQQTDSLGNYSFNGLVNGGTYTITPQMSGDSFSPASASITISGASQTANFSNTATTPPVTTFTGTLSYSGAAAGRVYVSVYAPNGNNMNVGTSFPQGGFPTGFSVQGAQLQICSGCTQNVVVNAWIDTLGIGRYNAAADPFATVTLSLTSTSGTISAGTLTLVDPTPTTPSAPTLQGVIPAESAAAVVYKGPQDGQGNELADAYNIYWSSSTSTPGPAVHDGVLTVQAGPGFGIPTGLIDGTQYYFGVTAVAGGNESAVTTFPSPVTIGPATGANAINGTVTFDNAVIPSATTAVYVVAQTSNGAPVVQRILTPVSPQAYSIPVPDGTYSLFAFADLGNDGIVQLGEPGQFGNGNGGPSATVAGSSVIGPTLNIATSNVVLQLATDHYAGIDPGGTYEGNNLSFSISSNMKIPVAAQITGGPLMELPIDVGIDRYNGGPNLSYQLSWQLWPTTPWVGDTYTVHLTYSDGTFEDLTPSVQGYITDLPTPLSPTAGATGVVAPPTFDWSGPVTQPVNPYTYSISVHPWSGGNDVWQYSGMPSSQTSVLYDVDNSGSPLSSATEYQWNLNITDSAGNVGSYSSYFTTQ